MGPGQAAWRRAREKPRPQAVSLRAGRQSRNVKAPVGLFPASATPVFPSVGYRMGCVKSKFLRDGSKASKTEPSANQKGPVYVPDPTSPSKLVSRASRELSSNLAAMTPTSHLQDASLGMEAASYLVAWPRAPPLNQVGMFLEPGSCSSGIRMQANP